MNKLVLNQASTAFVGAKLRELAHANLSRTLRSVRELGAYAIVDGRRVTNLCSNDYLGLSFNKHVLQASMRTKQVSPCSSRLLSGNFPEFEKLEADLAGHRGTESALVYPTGYNACVGAIASLATKDSTIFSDELNHASIIDGCRLSGARIEVFPHNDINALEKTMKKIKGRKIIVTEGVFSMDGDISELKSLAKLAKEHDSLTILDDAHGDFVRGPNFSGTAAECRVEVDVHISSLSKALGCFGGYVATSTEIRELLINSSRQFIYTSALPESLCKAARTALKLAKRGVHQKRLLMNISRFVNSMNERGLHPKDSPSQIVPIIIGDASRAVRFSKFLLDRGVYAQAIRYPTVPKDASRVRVSLTSLHTGSQLDAAARIFYQASNDVIRN